jgi:beta-glucosidase
MTAASFVIGVAPPSLPPAAELDAAAALAAGADVAVVVVGTGPAQESEGFDRATLALPDGQDELVRRVAAANPRTVVVVNAGSPVALPWRDEVAAVLVTWFPGQEAGHALADVLLGLREPGGRLPTTWPATGTESPVLSPLPSDGVLAYQEGLDVGYRAWARAGVPPAYPFGAGLGYTTWQLTGLDVPARLPAGAPLTARVGVRNTGGRRGRHVVQAYLRRPDSTGVPRPPLWLAGFAAVDLDAGAAATVEVDIAARAFAHWAEAGAATDGATGAAGWTVEPGAFELLVGSSSADLPLAATVAVVG